MRPFTYTLTFHYLMETQLLNQARDHVRSGDGKGLILLIESMKSSSLLEELSKAKVTKLVRQLLDALSKIPETLPEQQRLVKDLIQWATKDGRVYLKQYLDIRLVGIYFEQRQFGDALTLSGAVLKELRRMDDKMMLLEVQLLESKIHLALRNIPKSKAALTSARVYANAIYCPPTVQAALDMQAGILHAEESDFKTGFSYFYETFEGLITLEDQIEKSQTALKYMMICKIMLGEPDQVQPLFMAAKSKLVLTNKKNIEKEQADAVNVNTSKGAFISRDLDAVLAISKAYQHRSLKEFESTLETFKKEIEHDPLIQTHLRCLYDSLLEKNLVKIIEPYSKVELDHLAQVLSLPIHEVEAKLSQMILDKVIYGMLNQSTGCLIILDKPVLDSTYTSMLTLVKQMDHVVDALYQKTSALN
jgi:26S proteasome regulatory subunit N6